MITIDGSVATPRAAELLPRLCRHFAKKVESTWDEQRGEIAFPWGHCTLQASGDRLSFTCRAEDAEALAQVRNVLDLHVGMFSRKDPLRIEWR
ncbi:MAG TPA: DUF2218 domain-containing protein [Burkholderiaceae bacterium]|nr:DUF2218 domain-containing protein [Burkholderiaceae bacterium]